jgi:tRNA 2-selenouridine synthase
MEALISKLVPKKFLERSNLLPVVDVRAPDEFRQGHIPGAFSLPVFNDEERAAVGTDYTHSGKNMALLTGLEIAGPKLRFFVETARGVATNGELLLHCWRGGMRSEAMAWLLSFAGIKTSVLEGGYKAYRHYIRQSFNDGPPLVVLGGMTGSGKTELLNFLGGKGEQVLDLEALANHKGSAFGALGQPEQPTNEQFENDLAAKWLLFDPSRPVWVEDESRNIGKLIIPEPVFAKMAAALLVYIDVPFGERVKRLAEEYGRFGAPELTPIIEKISRRIGGDNVDAAIRSLKEGNIEKAVSIVLTYYDKTYQYGISNRDKCKIKTTSFAEFRRGFAELREEFKI